MSERLSNKFAQPESTPSSWRLVNLALGLAALLTFAGALGIFPSLVPSRWILAPWFSKSSMETVSPASVMIARIGINLWLPASVLMAVFWLAGLHRGLSAPSAKNASVMLGLAWGAHIATSLIPFMVSGYDQAAAGAIMFIIGMFATPIYVVFIVAGTSAAVFELRALIRHRHSTPSRVSVGLLGWAVAPPVLSLMPLLFAPSNPLALTSQETAAFTKLCQNVGVRLLEKPAGPVRSIAYDWDPRRLNARSSADRIEMEDAGRIVVYGGFSKPHSVEAKKKLVFDFTESRREGGRAGRAAINPDAPYYRFPDLSTKQPYYGVDALSADILLYFEVDEPDELEKVPSRQGAVRYRLTLTDRRSGGVLGTQTYVVDKVNRRACGANIENTISQAAFVYDAIHR